MAHISKVGHMNWTILILYLEWIIHLKALDVSWVVYIVWHERFTTPAISFHEKTFDRTDFQFNGCHGALISSGLAITTRSCLHLLQTKEEYLYVVKDFVSSKRMQVRETDQTIYYPIMENCEGEEGCKRFLGVVKFDPFYGVQPIQVATKRLPLPLINAVRKKCRVYIWERSQRAEYSWKIYSLRIVLSEKTMVQNSFKIAGIKKPYDPEGNAVNHFIDSNDQKIETEMDGAPVVCMVGNFKLLFGLTKKRNKFKPKEALLVHNMPLYDIDLKKIENEFFERSFDNGPPVNISQDDKDDYMDWLVYLKDFNGVERTANLYNPIDTFCKNENCKQLNGCHAVLISSGSGIATQACLKNNEAKNYHIMQGLYSSTMKARLAIRNIKIELLSGKNCVKGTCNSRTAIFEYYPKLSTFGNKQLLHGIHCSDETIDIYSLFCKIYGWEYIENSREFKMSSMIVYLTPPDECKNYFGIDTETYLCIDNTRNEINPKTVEGAPLVCEYNEQRTLIGLLEKGDIQEQRNHTESGPMKKRPKFHQRPLLVSKLCSDDLSTSLDRSTNQGSTIFKFSFPSSFTFSIMLLPVIFEK